MSEETTQTKNEQSASNTDGGNKSETASLIDRADSVAKRMEEANKKAEELILRQEAAAARMMLSGRAQAGNPIETPKQKMERENDERVLKSLKKYNFN